MTNSNKYITPAILIIIGILIIVLGNNSVFTTSLCGKYAAVNPLCWLGFLADVLLELFTIIIAGVFFLFGLIMLFIQDTKQRVYLSLALIFAVMSIITFFVFDPIPFIDEVLLPIFTLFFGAKGLMKSNESKMGF